MPNAINWSKVTQVLGVSLFAALLLFLILAACRAVNGRDIYIVVPEVEVSCLR
jgi:hypothetical protein